MAFGSSLKDSGGIPISQSYVPSVGFVAIQGGTVSSDGSNSSAPITLQLSDGVGLISSDVIGTTRYLKVSTVQDIELSSGNSSTTNIASGASFTGASASTLGVAAIQVCLFADQNCTIQVQQAQESPGVNWNIIDSWTYTANSTGNDAARTIQAMGASVQVVVTNNGGGTTTAFRLTTVLAPSADTLPRGLTQSGNLKAAIVELTQDNISIINAVGATTTQTSADLINNIGKGVIVVLDMTTVGTGSVTISIKGKEPVSGKYYTILTGAAVTTNSTNIYRIYPGLTPSLNATVNDLLPRTWQVIVSVNNANPTTYKVGAMLIP